MTQQADAVSGAQPAPLPQRFANALFYLAATLFAASLGGYFVTGAGGPMLLAVALVPLAVALAFLNDARHGELYARAGHWCGPLAATTYTTMALGASAWLIHQFDAIRIFRVGTWNALDLLAGATVVALVLEYTRRRYLPLFIIIVLLMLYAVYGARMPGVFEHGGLDWRRVLTASSLEMSTGVFERLPQLGLTLIASFILVLSALRAFGCIDSILVASSRLAARWPALLPQSAVLGSFAVAAVSGSGAANAATTGTATIPALIRAGFSRVHAAAVETASSIGGQLMPPLMGIAAFMMAEVMGVSYFDVVARGFAPALVYFIGVAVAVYLLSRRYHRHLIRPVATPMNLTDWTNLAAWLLAVGGLIWLMGVMRQPAMIAAQTVFLALLALFLISHGYRLLRAGEHDVKRWLAPLRQLIETFALTTAELVVLLATLGILTATFTVTGIPDAVGVLLMEMAATHLVLMVLVAFAFGYLVGMGLPVAPTYIVVAVVTAPFMIRAGLDPWVVHFFAFFVAVFGELSPPTSVTAAVTSRIAEAPFVRTMLAAMVVAIPLLLMMAAVFTRPELVVTPGTAQAGAFVLVLLGTLGTMFALLGRLHPRRAVDHVLRWALALVSLGVLLHPHSGVATGLAAVLAGGLCLAWWATLARGPAPGQDRADGRRPV